VTALEQFRRNLGADSAGRADECHFHAVSPNRCLSQN
jgi:hypothetical protein